MKYIFGDSHLRALERVSAGKYEDVKIISNHGKNFVKMDIKTDDNSVRIFSDNVANFDPIDLTVTGDDVVVFSAPLHSSLVSRHPMWRSHIHWQLASKHPQRKVVSSNFFDQVASSRIQSALSFLQSAKSLGARIAVLEPPLLSRKAIGFSQLTPAMLVLNDQSYRLAVRVLLDAIGVDVVSTPPQTNDGEFLLPEFEAASERDVHHGNGQYARLALQDAVDFLETGIVKPVEVTKPRLARRLLGLG